MRVCLVEEVRRPLGDPQRGQRDNPGMICQGGVRKSRVGFPLFGGRRFNAPGMIRW